MFKEGREYGDSQCGLFVPEAHQQLLLFLASCCQHARPHGNCLCPVSITGPVSCCSKHTNNNLACLDIHTRMHSNLHKEACGGLNTHSLGVMITHFRGRRPPEQQIQRCNGFISIVPGDQYRATLISHSHRKRNACVS